MSYKIKWTFSYFCWVRSKFGWVWGFETSWSGTSSVIDGSREIAKKWGRKDRKISKPSQRIETLSFATGIIWRSRTKRNVCWAIKFTDQYKLLQKTDDHGNNEIKEKQRTQKIISNLSFTPKQKPSWRGKSPQRRNSRLSTRNCELRKETRWGKEDYFDWK